jgi:effector-binding domain-containing protein
MVMEITTKQGQKTASIRTRTSKEGLKQELGGAFGEIMQLLGGQGVQPSGAPFSVYHNMDMEDLDVEIGYPVNVPFKAGGRVKPGVLPAGRTAVCVHKGPYETMVDSYNALTAFIAKNKAVPQGLCFESYLNDPQTTKPEDLLTEIGFPLID